MKKVVKVKHIVPWFRRNFKGSQERLIEVLIENFGGPKAMGETLDIFGEAILNWRRRGHIPLKKVGQLARAYGITQYAFNYLEVSDLLGEAPPWQDVLDSVELLKRDREYIESGKYPDA